MTLNRENLLEQRIWSSKKQMKVVNEGSDLPFYQGYLTKLVVC